MTRLLAVLSLSLLAAACQPSAQPATSPAASQGGARETTAQDREAVLASIQGFMDGLRAGDTTKMSMYVDSVTRFTLLRPTREGGTRAMVLSGTDFIRVVTRQGQPGIDEPIRNPVVHVSGDLASVWAEYQVRRGDTVTHCGFDAFHLARRNGRWMFMNIADTFQPTGCGTAWPR
jgi:ketosteroid isomerase-like protein